MSQPDFLERTLRRQPLRRPSARVYDRLFSREAPEQYSWWDGFAGLRRWFFPAASTLALAILVLSPVHPSAQDPLPIQLSASSDIVHAKFERFFSEHNVLPTQTLEWKFGAARQGAAPALLAFTNSLLKQ